MSIRTVQTSFTSQPTSCWTPQLNSPSSSVLHSVSMNQPASPVYTLTDRKYPPGLGYQAERVGRRRSGSFSYNSGNTYSSGNVSPAPQGPPNYGPLASPRRRASPRLPYIAPDHFHLAPTAIQTPSHVVKFDPFGSDDALSSPEPIYNHYWQYNPTTNSPMLVYTKPTTPATPVKASSTPNTVPYTIKLPSASSVSLPTTLSATPRPRAAPIAPPVIAPPKPDRNARARLVAGILLNRIYAVGKPMRRRFSAVNDKGYVKSGLSTVVSVEC